MKLKPQPHTIFPAIKYTWIVRNYDSPHELVCSRADSLRCHEGYARFLKSLLAECMKNLTNARSFDPVTPLLAIYPKELMRNILKVNVHTCLNGFN